MKIYQKVTRFLFKFTKFGIVNLPVIVNLPFGIVHLPKSHTVFQVSNVITGAPQFDMSFSWDDRGSVHRVESQTAGFFIGKISPTNGAKSVFQ